MLRQAWRPSEKLLALVHWQAGDVCPVGFVRLMHEPLLVPEGYSTDFASVPRLPITLLLFGNVGHRGAVVHDWLYTNAERSRGEADRIFRDLFARAARADRA